MQLVPLPNATGANNFIRQPNVEDESDRYLVRMDVPIGNSNNFFVRYIGSNRVRFVPGWFGGVLDGTSTSAWGRNFLDSHAVVGGWNKVLGSQPRQRVAGVVCPRHQRRQPGSVRPERHGADRLQGRARTIRRVAGGIVGIDIDGHIRLGSPNFMPKFQHTSQVQWMNTTTWMRGKHQVKFGIDLMMPMTNEYFDVAPTRGNLRFQATFTGNAFADFLIGYPNRAELTNVFVVTQQLWSSSFYVQDDWKPTDKLTLNLGLRYDFMPPATEKDNRLANFDPNGNGGRGALVYASDGSLADRALVNPDKNNFAPRIGAIYRINDQHAPSRRLRGVLQPVRSHRLRGSARPQPAGAAQHPGQLDGQHQPGVPDEGRVPDELPRSLEPGDPQPEAARRDPGRTADDGAAVWRRHRTRAGPQHGGVGRCGRLVHDTTSRCCATSISRCPARSMPTAPFRIPDFGNIQAREMNGEANYKGVDLSFEKRFSDGIGYRASYTIGEARDQAPEHLNASSGRAQNTRDLESWEGPSDFDIRHRFVANFIVELPFGEGKPMLQDGVAGKILGGWLLSGIYSARSGRAFTVTQGNNNVGADQTGMPNLTGDPKGAETVQQWFNPAAFTQVPSGAFGNAGRNILRGPGWITFDMSVQRRIDFNSRINTTFRAGHLQRLQSRQLRPAGGEHRRQQRRRDLEPGRRSARHAAVVEIWLLVQIESSHRTRKRRNTD